MDPLGLWFAQYSDKFNNRKGLVCISQRKGAFPRRNARLHPPVSQIGTRRGSCWKSCVAAASAPRPTGSASPSTPCAGGSIELKAVYVGGPLTHLFGGFSSEGR